MAFEFLLLAMIDGQEPMVLQRYNRDEYCTENVVELTEFVDRNYTDLRMNPEMGRFILLEELQHFNQKWELVAIEVPPDEIVNGTSADWSKEIALKASEAKKYGLDNKVDDLAFDATLLRNFASEYYENMSKPDILNETVPEGFIAKNRIEYVCIAAPVE